MRLHPFLILGLLAVCPIARGSLSMEDVLKLPPAKVEAALPNEHPAAYYGYAGRLFKEGKKDEAVFWFYVGQLRYRFHLKANPGLEPSGDPALFASLSATIGQAINEYAGGDVPAWIDAIDRALAWDAKNPNGFTSKQKFASIYEDNRAGLKRMRDQVAAQAETLRTERAKAGLENRKQTHSQ